MENSKAYSALESIARQMEAIPGHLGFYYKNLTTGYEFGVRETEVFSAATTQRYIGIEPQKIEQAIQYHAQLL